MGCKGSAHGRNGREDVFAISAETPDDDGTQRRHHHPNGVLGVGFVPHHANQQQRNEDAAQTVHGKNHQGEDRVAKAGELLTAKGDNGHEDGDDHRHEFRGFVLLSPFGFDVIGNGRRTRQHLAVGGGHGGGEDGSEDHTGQEGIEHFHC